MSSEDGTCEYVLDPDRPETWGGEEGDECHLEQIVGEYSFVGKTATDTSTQPLHPYSVV